MPPNVDEFLIGQVFEFTHHTTGSVTHCQSSQTVAAHRAMRHMRRIVV
jgi:hypothetical protein